jgi:small subunit ribosomal protein S20
VPQGPAGPPSASSVSPSSARVAHGKSRDRRESVSRGSPRAAPLLRWAPPAVAGLFTTVPNINQQKRRVRSAARERLENLRYRSAAKTHFKRLERAVADGDDGRAQSEHRELVRLLDKAAAHRAIHPNKAARKKSQAARLLAGRES